MSGPVTLLSALSTFSNQNPPWQLPNLDANFSSIAGVINNLIITGSSAVNLTQSGVSVGNGTLNWVTLAGAIAIVYCPSPIVFLNGSGGVPIVITGLPPSLTPVAFQTVMCSSLTSGSAVNSLGFVSIQPNGVFTVIPAQTIPSGGFTSIQPTSGFAANTSCQLQAAWQITYSLL